MQLQIRWVTQGWTTVDTVQTDTTGQASGTWKAYTGGDYRVRAVAPASGGAARVVSGTQVVEVTCGPEVPPDEYDPITPGRLTIKPRAQTTMRLGRYRVRVNASVPGTGFPRGRSP